MNQVNQTMIKIGVVATFAFKKTDSFCLRIKPQDLLKESFFPLL
ncbi:hypothetical protein OAG52_01900 [Verrucomicrobia bacterium]|nr:hypothetical protein [Verrucomicrobiota bacterium]